MFIWRNHGSSIHFTLSKWIKEVHIYCMKTLKESKMKMKMNNQGLDVMNASEIGVEVFCRTKCF